MNGSIFSCLDSDEWFGRVVLIMFFIVELIDIVFCFVMV